VREIITDFLFVHFNQKYYFSSAKKLMRLNDTTKSPIANHFGESIVGTMTIRAFRVEDQFFKKNLDLIDKNSSPFFYGFLANEWLIQRLEMLNATVICSSALAMVLLPKGSFNPGMKLNNETKCQLCEISAVTRHFYI